MTNAEFFKRIEDCRVEVVETFNASDLSPKQKAKAIIRIFDGIESDAKLPVSVCVWALKRSEKSFERFCVELSLAVSLGVSKKEEMGDLAQFRLIVFNWKHAGKPPDLTQEDKEIVALVIAEMEKMIH